MKYLFLIFILSLFVNAKNITLQQSYINPKDYVFFNEKLKLNTNGRTIECPNAIPGSFEKLENIKYYIAIDKFDLINAISKYRIDEICTTHVKDMSYLFYLKNINANISSWDVSNVENMAYMFYGCDVFNKNINNWDVSNITNLSYTFVFTKLFNQPLNQWKVSNVLNTTRIFYFAKPFNQFLGLLDFSNVFYADEMFSSA